MCRRHSISICLNNDARSPCGQAAADNSASPGNFYLEKIGPTQRLALPNTNVCTPLDELRLTEVTAERRSGGAGVKFTPDHYVKTSGIVTRGGVVFLEARLGIESSFDKRVDDDR